MTAQMYLAGPSPWTCSSERGGVNFSGTLGGSVCAIGLLPSSSRLTSSRGIPAGSGSGAPLAGEDQFARHRAVFS